MGTRYTYDAAAGAHRQATRYSATRDMLQAVALTRCIAHIVLIRTSFSSVVACLCAARTSAMQPSMQHCPPGGRHVSACCSPSSVRSRGLHVFGSTRPRMRLAVAESMLSPAQTCGVDALPFVPAATGAGVPPVLGDARVGDGDWGPSGWVVCSCACSDADACGPAQVLVAPEFRRRRFGGELGTASDASVERVGVAGVAGVAGF